ncbi:recombinase zinc beta ribbon domain-containing protein [Chloroflexota bacterium]
MSNHKGRRFSKDTVKDMKRNRFYIGYIPDGNGGWLKAKHGPFVTEDLFEVVQKVRASRANQPRTVRSDASIYSLTGIARCADCGSTMRTFKGRGRVRTVCNGRIKTGDCNTSQTATTQPAKCQAAGIGEASLFFKGHCGGLRAGRHRSRRTSLLVACLR